MSLRAKCPYDSALACACVCVCRIPSARKESELRTRLHRKQRIAVILPLIPLVLLFVVPLFILRCGEPGCARRPVPLSV